VKVTTRGSEDEVPSRWRPAGDFGGRIPRRCGDFTAFFQKLRIFKNILVQISAEKHVF